MQRAMTFSGYQLDSWASTNKISFYIVEFSSNRPLKEKKRIEDERDNFSNKNHDVAYLEVFVRNEKTKKFTNFHKYCFSVQRVFSNENSKIRVLSDGESPTELFHFEKVTKVNLLIVIIGCILIRKQTDWWSRKANFPIGSIWISDTFERD